MAQLFPAWADSALKSAIVGGAALVLGAPAALMWWVRSPLETGRAELVEQPVKFDHRHHVRDDGISCNYCHVDAARSRYAGVPATSVCMGCHSQIWTQSPELEPVRASLRTGKPIEWQRVDNLPDHVFFDHSAHVGKGVTCDRCHGDVSRMAIVYQERTLLMGDCLDCHRHPEKELPTDVAAKVHPPTDCTGCHR